VLSPNFSTFTPNFSIRLNDRFASGVPSDTSGDDCPSAAGRTKTCGLYFHGESYGWEVQIRDGEFLEYGERCMFHERAVRLANELRGELERDGWSAKES